MILKYEDFVSKPKTIFKMVCNYLNIPFELEALKEKNPNKDRLKVDPHLFLQITTNTKNWEDYITTNEKELIQNKLTAEMKYFDYSMY